ncbi:unnamed protein product [Lepeophtheirus salmonis]|uniref:(salmon louse) hypothetical protein n=1 Tax=Lepeophtheirus salmonis TaxID=72036 RepID=A0A7R8D6P1_LEPSM|nr:unnamed protein product [Lepeophtheirus salmonis]CAF3046990.1 unnamed protein product [Lepeophtheirus salmonis]
MLNIRKKDCTHEGGEEAEDESRLLPSNYSFSAHSNVTPVVRGKATKKTKIGRLLSKEEASTRTTGKKKTTVLYSFKFIPSKLFGTLLGEQEIGFHRMASSENKKLQVNEKSSFESTEEEEDTKGKPFSSISIRQSSELDRTKEEDYSQKDEDVDSSRLSTITDAIVSAFSKEEEENDSQKEDSNVYKSEDKNREEVTPGGGGTTTNIINKKKKSNDNHDDVKEEKMSSERAKILEEEKKMFSKVQQPTRSKFIEAPRKSEVVVTNETVRECLNPLGQEVTEEICVPSSSYKTFTTLNQEVEDEIIVPKSTCVLNTKPTLTSSAQMIGGSAKSYGAEMQTRVLTMKISGNTDINMEDFKNKMETCVEEMQPGCSKDMSIDSKTRESNEGNLEREITLTLKSGSQSIDSQKLQQEMYNALTRRSKKFEHENKHQTESASIKIREFKLSMSDQVDFDITDFSQKNESST